MSMDTQMENQMLRISQYYSGLYGTHDQEAEQDKGEKKRRYRKKKSKEESSRGSGGNRQLNPEQANFLEMNFGNEHKLESKRKERLASEVGLDPRQVAVWFQNRRARWRNKKLEEEYSRLKTEHEKTIIDNFHLQTEVFRLKEQLTETDHEIQRLMERSEINSSNSPISSLSVEPMADQPHFLEEFGMGELEDIFNVPEINYNIHGMDWVNLYM